MNKYYKHIKSGDVYKFLFEAEDKSYYGFETREKIIDVVYEDLQGNKYTRQKEEFEAKFKRCNGPVDWRKLYKTHLKRNAQFFQDYKYYLTLSPVKIPEGIQKSITRRKALQPYLEKRLSRYE